jgi:hypothetical protein
MAFARTALLLRILLAHREELDVSNIPLNFFCWYLRKFPRDTPTMSKKSAKSGVSCRYGTTVSLEGLTRLFNMSYVRERCTYTVATTTSPHYASVVCNLRSQPYITRLTKIVTSAQLRPEGSSIISEFNSAMRRNTKQNWKPKICRSLRHCKFFLSVASTESTLYACSPNAPVTPAQR